MNLLKKIWMFCFMIILLPAINNCNKHKINTNLLPEWTDIAFMVNIDNLQTSELFSNFNSKNELKNIHPFFESFENFFISTEMDVSNIHQVLGALEINFTGINMLLERYLAGEMDDVTINLDDLFTGLIFISADYNEKFLADYISMKFEEQPIHIPKNIRYVVDYQTFTITLTTSAELPQLASFTDTRISEIIEDESILQDNEIPIKFTLNIILFPDRDLIAISNYDPHMVIDLALENSGNIENEEFQNLTNELNENYNTFWIAGSFNTEKRMQINEFTIALFAKTFPQDNPYDSSAVFRSLCQSSSWGSGIDIESELSFLLKFIFNDSSAAEEIYKAATEPGSNEDLSEAETERLSRIYDSFVIQNNDNILTFRYNMSEEDWNSILVLSDR